MSDQSHDRVGEEHGRKPTTFKVQIDKAVIEVATATPTARELLMLAGKQPPEQYGLYLRPKGGQPQRIDLDDTVDLREPGIDRFVTLPLDQTEGRCSQRRQFALPAEDTEWLEARGLAYELVAEGGVLRVVIYDMPVPPGYTVGKVDVNVRIEPGYPDNQIDMAYFYPALMRADGRPIGCVCDDPFDGRTWQRWSRHRTLQNPWRPGLDNLGTHFALVEDWLARELQKA